MRAVNFPPKTNKNLDPKKEIILLDKNVRMLHFSSKNSIHGAYNKIRRGNYPSQQLPQYPKQLQIFIIFVHPKSAIQPIPVFLQFLLLGALLFPVRACLAGRATILLPRSLDFCPWNDFAQRRLR